MPTDVQPLAKDTRNAADHIPAAGDAPLPNHVPQLDARVIQLPDGRWSIGAPAKLNLGLRIFPARPDGFHDLESWMVPLAWHDTLLITPGRPLELYISGRSEGIPTDLSNNLVGRAALLLAKEAGIEPTGLVELHKVVPPGGGLGGGSSDAASALVALDSIWQTHLGEATLLRLAAELGSDVPFFVNARSAFCTGRGEILHPLRAYNRLFAVLLLPPQGIGTKSVYEVFDRGGNPAVADTWPWQQWAALPAEALNGVLANDLQPPAFSLAPWLRELCDQASTLGGQKVHMTGSGSTLFTLTSSAARAAELKCLFTEKLSPACACVSARILC